VNSLSYAVTRTLHVNRYCERSNRCFSDSSSALHRRCNRIAASNSMPI